MLSGVMVPVHLVTSHAVDEEQIAKILTDVMTTAKLCKPAVAPLVHQYNQSTVQHKRSLLKHRIRNEHQRALRGSCPDRMLSHCVKLVTDCSLCGIHLDHAVVKRNIILYCRVKTIEALSDLQQMIDSGLLSQLFSGIFTASANTGLLSRLFGSICSPFPSTRVTVILSTEEYQSASSLLTSAGKLSLML